MKKYLLYGFLGFIALNVFIFVWFAASSKHTLFTSGELDKNNPDIALLDEHAALKFQPRKQPELAQKHPSIDSAPAQSKESTPVFKILRCYNIGPIKTKIKAKQLADGLRALEMSVVQRIEAPKKLMGHWVYLAPPGGKAAARIQMQELKNKGITDIALLTKQQPKYAISLGLFKQQKTANQRLEEILALGYPALLTERYADTQTNWLDIELEESRTLEEERWQKMLEKYPGATLTEAVCA